ncbi:serine/threonine protein kinase [Salpingoeca rosetta]|uniref:Serine/threonine protein kinase n=1 Tax=Salpingoeca rosetta (strain ATCC 50818 / BSB-021) TaxID=946362 RepID=F2UGI3_SALR5|nr:serine/threonine protein kinase [Salpingoeca rosetta]EGD75733.1 serine/threonine protein kinase [Salpingoeca rosetta]|eukprot:XP_004991654.1 serine/threonine protein kinase [Salpingoeca rosetta]
MGCGSSLAVQAAQRQGDGADSASVPDVVSSKQIGRWLSFDQELGTGAHAVVWKATVLPAYLESGRIGHHALITKPLPRAPSPSRSKQANGSVVNASKGSGAQSLAVAVKVAARASSSSKCQHEAAILRQIHGCVALGSDSVHHHQFNSSSSSDGGGNNSNSKEGDSNMDINTANSNVDTHNNGHHHNTNDNTNTSVNTVLFSRISRRHILPLLDVFTSKRGITHIVLPLAPHGDLFHFIADRSEQLEEQECQHITTQVVCALNCLHTLGIGHLDLKPENVLLFPHSSSSSSKGSSSSARHQQVPGGDTSALVADDCRHHSTPRAQRGSGDRTSADDTNANQHRAAEERGQGDEAPDDGGDDDDEAGIGSSGEQLARASWLQKDLPLQRHPSEQQQQQQQQQQKQQQQHIQNDVSAPVPPSVTGGERVHMPGLAFEVRLCDFTEAVRVDPSSPIRTGRVGTHAYMCPEMLAPANRYHPHQADMWSLGAVLAFMMTGDIIFEAPTLDLTANRVISSRLPLPPSIHRRISRAGISFLLWCLRRDAHLRMTAQAAAKHTWVTGSKGADNKGDSAHRGHAGDGGGGVGVQLGRAPSLQLAQPNNGGDRGGAGVDQVDADCGDSAQRDTTQGPNKGIAGTDDQPPPPPPCRVVSSRSPDMDVNALPRGLDVVFVVDVDSDSDV